MYVARIVLQCSSFLPYKSLFIQNFDMQDEQREERCTEDIVPDRAAKMVMYMLIHTQLMAGS